MKVSKRIKIVVGIYVLAVTLILSSCTNKDATELIDYSKTENWVSLPTITKDVDVFFVYPTIYSGKDPKNMDIADPDLRELAAGLLTSQAGVYSPHANLFAPYYRQQTAATQPMEANNGGHDAYADPNFIIGYNDVERAFDYYIEHLNQGRPFILAGHSQGSMVLIELLRKRFNDPILQAKLVAAYTIGYSVTKTDLVNYPWMHLAQGEKDTGVIITYNTQGPHPGESPVLLIGALAINPLNWKTDVTPATCELNQKAVFFDKRTGEIIEEVPNFSGAYIDTISGALVVTDMKSVKSDKIDIVDLGRWSEQVYHKFDYAFFYENLKENVGKRIAAYLSK